MSYPSVAVALLLAVAPPATVVAQSASAPNATARRITALADRYLAAWTVARPEDILGSGLAGGDQGAIVDNRPAALGRWHAIEDTLLRAVRAIDPTSTRARPEYVTYAILRQTLEGSIGARVCRFEWWNISPGAGGWLGTYAAVASIQPTGSAATRADAVRRVRALGRYVEREIPNLRAGLLKGYVAPQILVAGVLTQLDEVLALDPAESPFASPATRDSTPDFRVAMRDAIRDSLYPSLKRYRDFLRVEYLPKARTTLGVSVLPRGKECYAATVRLHSTLTLSGDSIHRLGLAEVDRLDAEMRGIAAREFKSTDVRAMLTRLRTDTAYSFRTRDEIRDSARAAIARAQAAAPRFFGTVPKAKVEVRDYPEFRAKAGAIGEASPPGADGSPAIYFINTYDPLHKPRAAAEPLAFHEGSPGHGLQLSLAAEQRDAHPIVRALVPGGFVEGWGLYAEQLAEEMGAYSSDLGRLGLRASQSARAARLVVDPALHVMGWSRQQAIDYLSAHTTWDDRLIAAEVDRYIGLPGQATSYMLGRLEIVRLRAKAERELGDRFDIRGFHDAILGHGSLTLPAMETFVDEWIAGRKR
ncbi:DUF885 domain-containing protein [Gemmatimonas groenlandica]|uniref:DUF885 domain-containing protein n=1 Tax=Gemmatimonas groenlandica TaxID=2732249 RepID=A0A6M4IXE8_9BACT|nr:DUF885 domain-containing protein [Gemmatimonas groenlandica]QJR37582.1 DUF885 domain-containing protein [Gemmatimonas groenlandica]